MQKWRIKLNFETDQVEVDPKVAKFILKYQVETIDNRCRL